MALKFKDSDFQSNLLIFTGKSNKKSVFFSEGKSLIFKYLFFVKMIVSTLAFIL